MSNLDEITTRAAELENERQQLTADLTAAELEAGQLVADGKDAAAILAKRRGLANKLEAVLTGLGILRERETEARQRQDAADQKRITQAARDAVAQAHDTAAELEAALPAIFAISDRLHREMHDARQLVRQVRDDETKRTKLAMNGIENIAALVDGWKQHYNTIK